MSTATIAVDTTQPAADLKPKEHGAYAIIGIPIVTALIIAGPTAVGLGVAIASFAGFFAHEPLLVSIGRRGKRAQRTTPAATRRLWTLVGLMAVGGLLALMLGDPSVRISLAMCGLLAGVSFAIALAGKHKTLGGQLFGVMGLSVPCVPILLAGNLSVGVTAEAWCTWLIGFASTTMAVRGVIAAQKRKSRWLYWSSLAALSLAVAALTAAGYRIPIITLPMIAMSWYLMISPPPAKQLKRVGWALVLGTVASAIWMVAVC